MQDSLRSAVGAAYQWARCEAYALLHSTAKQCWAQVRRFETLSTQDCLQFGLVAILCGVPASTLQPPRAPPPVMLVSLPLLAVLLTGHVCKSAAGPARVCTVQAAGRCSAACLHAGVRVARPPSTRPLPAHPEAQSE